MDLLNLQPNKNDTFHWYTNQYLFKTMLRNENIMKIMVRKIGKDRSNSFQVESKKAKALLTDGSTK